MKEITKSLIVTAVTLYTVAATWISCEIGFMSTDPFEIAFIIGISLIFFGIGALVFVLVIWLAFILMKGADD